MNGKKHEKKLNCLNKLPKRKEINMKKTLLLCCVLSCLTKHIIATDNAVAEQQVTKPGYINNENKINPETKRAQDLASLAVDMFILINCAVLEKCNYAHGYCACVLDVRMSELRAINTEFAKSLFCHLYLWFEKTEKIIKEAYNSNQKRINLPAIDPSFGKDIEINLEDHIKRVQTEETNVKKESNITARFFPFK